MADDLALQRADELPLSYRSRLDELNLLPAWTLLRAVMPVGAPTHQAKAAHWSFGQLRPLLLQAAELVPMEKAERRVLAYVNAGMPRERLATMPSIFFGLQLIMPGERAPKHKHIPAAARLMIEGAGAYTTVDDEKLYMEVGDLIITPPIRWHDHGHEGSQPVIWMDVLDHPIAVPMDVSYVTPGALTEHYNEQPDSGEHRYSCPGLVPYRLPGQPTPDYPLRRFRWSPVREALIATSDVTDRDQAVHLRYCNPETGESVLKTLEFSVHLLRSGETRRLETSSVNRVFQIIEGRAEIQVNGDTFFCDRHDTATAPTYASIELQNPSGAKPCFLLQVDDAPTQIKLGFYERLRESKAI